MALKRLPSIYACKQKSGWNARKYNASLGKRMFSRVFALFIPHSQRGVLGYTKHPHGHSKKIRASAFPGSHLSSDLIFCGFDVGGFERQEWILVLAVQCCKRGTKIASVHCKTTDTYLYFVAEPTSGYQA